MVRFMGDPASLSDIARLAKQTCPDVIAWACTSGSFIDGGTMGDRQVEALSTAADVPAITTSKAILAALHDLNASRVGVITPYLPEIGARFVDYLEAAGFVVTSQEHLGGGSDIEVGALCPESFGEAAAKVRNGSDAIARYPARPWMNSRYARPWRVLSSRLFLPIAPRSSKLRRWLARNDRQIN